MDVEDRVVKRDKDGELENATRVTVRTESAYVTQSAFYDQLLTLLSCCFLSLYHSLPQLSVADSFTGPFFLIGNK